eukprot:m.359247 g.359247  ORF g.359247 m.359247 type:complete len:93 (+) comp18489_c0_seq1:1879-2157(+)
MLSLLQKDLHQTPAFNALVVTSIVSSVLSISFNLYIFCACLLFHSLFAHDSYHRFKGSWFTLHSSLDTPTKFLASTSNKSTHATKRFVKFNT